MPLGTFLGRGEGVVSLGRFNINGQGPVNLPVFGG
jgi:hypothetical protein